MILDVPLMLAGIWVASELMPLVPSLDLQLVKESLKALLVAPQWRAAEAFRDFAAWLVVLHFLWSSTALRRWRMFVPLLPFAVMAVEPFIVSHELNLSEVIGALAAVAVWSVARTRLHPALLGVLLLVGTLASNLFPIDFAFARNNFSWIPFADLLDGSMLVNVTSLVQKIFLYGAVVWLLKEAGMGWAIPTMLMFVALIVQEGLQIYVSGASAGVTDPVLAVMTAIAMYAVARHSKAITETKSVVTPKRIKTSREPPPTIRTDPNPSIGHLGSLDGLRGLAAFAVFCVHFDQAANLHGTLGPFDLGRFLINGNTGVALFFVLSGFLLSIPFWRTQRAGKSADVKTYAIRRLARILPAYYVCLFLLIWGKGLLAGSWPSINDILSHVLFLHNLKDDNVLNINPPFWTLAVEMQFYLLLPLLFVVLRRLSQGVSFGIVLFLCVGTYLANYELVTYLVARNHWPINIRLIWPFALEMSGPDSFILTYSTLGHLTFFFAGLASAWLFLQLGEVKRGAWIRDVLFWTAALAIVVILSTPLDDVLELPFGHYNWPVIPFLIAVMVFAAPQAKTAIAVLRGPASWLGLISYGVYIYHYPILQVVQTAMASAGLGVMTHWLMFGAASFAATIATASISYVFLEKPVMQAARGMRPFQIKASAPSEPTQIAVREPEAMKAPTSSKGWSKVEIGLRSEQISYLKRVSGHGGRSLSGATRHVIADFIKRLAQEDSGTRRAGELSTLGSIGKRSEDGTGHQPRRREHQHVINLPNDYVEFLNALSGKLGITMSRTVQMIVDDFINTRVEQENPRP